MISLRLERKFAQKIIIPLWVVTATSIFIEQLLARQIEQEVSSPTGISKWLYLYGVLSVLLSVLFPLVQSGLGVLGFFHLTGAKINFSGDFSRKIEQLFIESLRAWGTVIFYTLLFVLPGIYKFCHLVFVPFVVLLSRSYEEGQVDALKASVQVFKKRRLQTLVLMFVFQLFLPLVLVGIFDEYKSFVAHPLGALVLSFIDTLLLLLFMQNLLNVFAKSSEGEIAYEQSILSVEGR